MAENEPGTEVSTVTNPFRNDKLPAQRSGNAGADVAVQRELAEVQAAVMMARRFPRDPVQSADRILQACTRRGLAEEALYSYSRGGTEITGPSIRLAEAIAQGWGNIQYGVRELEQRSGESTVEAYAWDLETNTRESKVFQVPHIRYTRQGAQTLKDPRDIYELVANQGARRLRSCILGVIPGDVTESAQNQCEATLKASGDNSVDAIKAMVEAFKGFGVSAEQIAARCQCHLEAIRPAQLIQLRKIYTSLKEGMSKASDWFTPIARQADMPPQEEQQRKTTYLVTASDGEVQEFKTIKIAEAAFEEVYKEAARQGPKILQGALESNQAVLAQIHKEDPAAANRIGAVYNELRTALEAMPQPQQQQRTTQAPVQTEMPIQQNQTRPTDASSSGGLAKASDSNGAGEATNFGGDGSESGDWYDQTQDGAFFLEVPMRGQRKEWRAWMVAKFIPRLKGCRTADHVSYLVTDNEANLKAYRDQAGDADKKMLDEAINEQQRKIGARQ